MQTFGHSRLKDAVLWLLDQFLILFFIFDKRLYRRRHALRGLVVRRILVARLDHLGDVILATAAFGQLRALYPAAEITVLAGSWSAELLRYNATVDAVITLDCPWWLRQRGQRVTWGTWLRLFSIIRHLRRQRFDLFIDLRGDVRHVVLFGGLGMARHNLSYARTGGRFLLDGWLRCEEHRHELFKNCDLIALLGCSPAGPLVEVPTSCTERRRVDALLAGCGIDGKSRKIVLHPRAKTINRWPAESFAQLARMLLGEVETKILVTGTTEDVDLAAAIVRVDPSRIVSLAGDTTLLDLCELWSRAECVICADTGPMHLLNTISTPAVLLFGPTEATRFAPLSRRVQCIQAKVCCEPGLHQSCKWQRSAQHSYCMQTIRVRQVYEMIRVHLGAIANPKPAHDLCVAQHGPWQALAHSWE